MTSDTITKRIIRHTAKGVSKGILGAVFTLILLAMLSIRWGCVWPVFDGDYDSGSYDSGSYDSGSYDSRDFSDTDWGSDW